MPVWDPSQLQDIQWGYLQPVRKTVPVTQIPFLAWTPLRMDVSTNLIDRQWAELAPPPRKLPFMTALQLFEPIAAEPQRYDPTIYNDEPWIDGQAVRLKMHPSRMPFRPDSSELLRYDFRQYIDKPWTDPRDIGNSLAFKRVSTVHYPSFGTQTFYFNPDLTDYYLDRPWQWNDPQALRPKLMTALQMWQPQNAELLRYDPSLAYVDRPWQNNDPQALRLKMPVYQQPTGTRAPDQWRPAANTYYVDWQWADPRDIGNSLAFRKVSTIHYPSFGIPTDFYTPDFDAYVDRPWQWNDPQATRNRVGPAQLNSNANVFNPRPWIVISDTYKWPEEPRFKPYRLDRQNVPIQDLAPFFFGPPRLIAQALNWWTNFPDSYRRNPVLPVSVQDYWYSNELDPFYIDWFMPFRELQVVPPKIQAADQLVAAYSDEPDNEEQFWFMALSEPKRFPKKLIEAAHPDQVRNLRFFYKPSGRGYIVN